MDQNFILALGLVVTAALITMACLLCLTALRPMRLGGIGSIFTGPEFGMTFIFDAEVLVDATPAAKALIHDPLPIDAWHSMLARLGPMFPTLQHRLRALAQEGRFLLSARDDLAPGLTLRGEYANGLTRLSLFDSQNAVDGSDGDAFLELSLQDELAALRAMLAAAPLPIWRQDPTGAVIWANAAYLNASHCNPAAGERLDWPLPQLFTPAPDLHNQALSRRCGPGGEGHFDLQLAHDPSRDELLCFALPADALHHSEALLRDTTQTLAKTFAHLPIGLAIFDEQRVLHMFNPALLDLSGLPADFLIARPSIAAMLDAMRERGMLPEPRDYRSWRQQLIDMEARASSGNYEDVWSLMSGRTYRVTGRPHPNGSLAFMLEDISGETTRIRQYRVDLELAQAVIDAMADAVVVLGQDGSPSLANKAAGHLWGQTLIAGALAAPGSVKLVAHWRQSTAPTLLWNDLEQFIGQFGPREPWDGELRLQDGRLLTCRIAPLSHAATMVSFKLVNRPGERLGADPVQKAIMIA